MMRPLKRADIICLAVTSPNIAKMNSLTLCHMANSHCCSSSKLWCHNNIDSGNDKYQIHVAKLQTDTIKGWLFVI